MEGLQASGLNVSGWVLKVAGFSARAVWDLMPRNV